LHLLAYSDDYLPLDNIVLYCTVTELESNVAVGQTIPLSGNYSKRNNDIPRGNKTVKKFKTKNKQLFLTQLH